MCKFIPPNTHIQIFLFFIHHSHTYTNKTESKFCPFMGCTPQIHQDWDNSMHAMMYKTGAWSIILQGKKSVFSSQVRQKASRHFQHCNFGDRYLRSTCFLKLARPLQLFCTILSLQQASMQILPVAPYVDTPAQFNVKHKTEQWGFPVVKNKRRLKLEMSGFRMPSKISLVTISNSSKALFLKKMIL